VAAPCVYHCAVRVVLGSGGSRSGSSGSSSSGSSSGSSGSRSGRSSMSTADGTDHHGAIYVAMRFLGQHRSANG
jgi:hypothetical protein